MTFHARPQGPAVSDPTEQVQASDLCSCVSEQCHRWGSHCLGPQRLGNHGDTLVSQHPVSGHLVSGGNILDAVAP